MSQTETMYIELFQDFVIHYRGKKLRMSDYLSKQTLSLLETLILNYNTTVSKEHLMEILWPNNDNPDSALKFNIFRLRKLLSEVEELSDLTLIHTDKNGYRFHPDVVWDSDCHEFELLYRKLDQKSSFEQKDYDDMNHMLDIYKGKFFHTNICFWFVQIEQYYVNAYLRFITPLCEHYLENEDYDEVLRIVQKAAALEPSIESNYYYQILAYEKLNEYAIAYECYQNAVDCLTNEFEIEPSDRIKNLYQKLINENNQKFDPETIMEHYRTREFNKGAFYCTSAVFDYIYEMRLRSAQRDEMKLYLYIVELDNSNEESLDESMKKLKLCIIQALRGSDVFTKLNRSQYLILVSCPSEEIAYKIAQRINSVYRNKVDHKKNTLHYHLRQIND